MVITLLRVSPFTIIHSNGVVNGQVQIWPALAVVTATVSYTHLDVYKRQGPKGLGTEVIAGSYNLSAAVQVRIDKIGQTTRYAQIVALMERVSAEKPRLAILADRIARPFLITVLFAAAASAAFWWQEDHGRALMAAVAVLIVTCPCALSLATPAAMLTVSGALAKSGVLVRKMQALEALTTIDTVVFDQTGTLTHDLSLIHI